MILYTHYKDAKGIISINTRSFMWVPLVRYGLVTSNNVFDLQDLHHRYETSDLTWIQ